MIISPFAGMISYLNTVVSKQFWLACMLALFALGSAELSHRSGWLGFVEHIYSDLWHRLSGVRHVPEHVALVVIDDQVLAEHGDDPLVFWTPHIAQATATLQKAGVKIIGLDILFAASAESWLRKMNLPENALSRTYGAPFRTQLNSGKVILVGAKFGDASSGFDDFLLPHRDYLVAIPEFDFNAHVGLSDLATDENGIVRSFVTAPLLRTAPEMAEQSLPRLTLSTLLAVRATDQSPEVSSWQLGGHTVRRNEQLHQITYSGPPGTVSRISLSRLLAPNALQDPLVQTLKDKVVIIGGEFLGMNDLHFTPYSSAIFGRSGSLMTGPEVQANMVETLLSGNYNRPLPPALRLLYLGLLICSATLLYIRMSPWGGLLLCTGLFLGAALLGFILFKAFIMVPLAPLQIGLLMSYLGIFGIRLTTGERERSRITKLFGRYVSDEVVQLLLKSKNLPKLGGESLPVTMLFADIRNFTSSCEKLNAQEVVEMLNEYFKRACEPLLAEGGSIDKFIGDAIMVQFGSPVRHPDHALRAIRAALALQAIADEFKFWMADRFAGRDLPTFAIGIGIHTGDAVIGNIGSPKRSEFTAIGDTVNIASRLEGMTKTLGCTILASKQTLSAAGYQGQTGKHEWIHIKGRAQPIEVFEILGLFQQKGNKCAY